VTLQKAQIQALVNDIDRVLGKASPRLPWVMSGDATQQRQVLEQTRNYLVSLQQQVSASEFEPSGTGSDLVDYDASLQPVSSLSRDQLGQGAAVESAQQVLQAVLEEMSYLRANVMQPLRSDLDEMNQQRDSLIQEIKQLQAERQQYALPQGQTDQRLTAEFFQSLTTRLREDLTGQVAQLVAGLDSQTPGRALRAARSEDGSEGEPDFASQSLLTPAQRLEQLQMIQAQSDQLILKLDTTLRVVFDSLQDSVKSYQESLGQGLDRMHGLGQQGEAMFAALMNRLAEELGRGASSYLQSSVQTTDWEPRPTLQGARQTSATGATPTETAPPPETAQAAQSVADQVTGAEIDQLLNELNAIAPSTTSDQALDQTNIEDSVPGFPAAPVTPVTEADLEDLDLLTFEIDDLPLVALSNSDADSDADDVTNDITVFQESEVEGFPWQESLQDDDITLFQQDEETVSLTDLSLDEALAADLTDAELLLTDSPSEPRIADLDSALDLLNQLSVELHESPQEEPQGAGILESAITPEPPDENRVDGASASQPDLVSMGAADSVVSPDNLYNQLDDLYQNIFGLTGAAATDSEVRLSDLSANELAADLGVEPIASPPTSAPEANIPGDLVNESSEQAIAAFDDALLSSELSNELFGGLSDPATGSLPQPTASTTLDIFESDSASDSANDDLMDTEIPPREESNGGSEDITAELLSPPLPPPTAPEGLDTSEQNLSELNADELNTDEVDTITNLSDLLEPDLLEPEPVVAEVELAEEPENQPEIAIAPTEDTYVAAAPDEDLLVNEDLQSESGVDFQLDSDILQQLTADLSNLEGLQGGDLSSLEADLETADSPDWTLADWTSPELEVEPPSSPPDVPEDANRSEAALSEPEIETIESPIEAIAPADRSAVSPPPVADTPDTTDDLFFPDTSDLSDLLSYQEALAAEVVDREVSFFEDEELGIFADQEVDTFSESGSESGVDLPLLDQDTTLADLFDSSPSLSSDPDLELEEDLLSDEFASADFEDLAPQPPQRETTLEDLFAIAEVDTSAPPIPPSEELTPDSPELDANRFDSGMEQLELEPFSSGYDTTLEDLFDLPSDDFPQAASLPEGEYTAAANREPLQFTETTSQDAALTDETTLEELFDLPGAFDLPEPDVSLASDAALSLDDSTPDIYPAEVYPTQDAPVPPALDDSSTTLDFLDFDGLELQADGVEETNALTLEGLDSLFEEMADTGSNLPSTGLTDEPADFEPPLNLETNLETNPQADAQADSQDLTLESVFAEPEAPMEYGSATDLSFSKAAPPVEYGSATDLFSFEAAPATEYDSSTDLDFLEAETPDVEDPEKKTLDSDLTETVDAEIPNAEMSDAEMSDAEVGVAEPIPDWASESELELETGAETAFEGLLESHSEPFADFELEPETADPAETSPVLEAEPTLEDELVLEDELAESAIAPESDEISAELPVEPPIEFLTESPLDLFTEPPVESLAEPLVDSTTEDALEDWSDRLPADFPADFVPPDLPASELEQANPFPDLALLDLGFGLESGLTGEATPSSPAESAEPANNWYLGIDFGTAGISAVLLNHATCELYPIYWSETRPQDEGGFVADKSFRLPTLVYVSTGRDNAPDPNLASPNQDQSAITSVAIGSLALDLNQRSHAESASPNADSSRLLLRDFKPFLGIGIPHYSPQTLGWEPVLQWSDHHQLELSWLHQSLQTLLATLSHHRLATPTNTALSCAAVGLDAAAFQTALRQLAGVVMGYPANWSDTYSFNIREAVLGARLVAHPEQIFFIEDAIATLLSGLRSADGRAVVLPNNLSQKPYLYNTDWQGSTLVISAGASVTEMALVDLPSSLQNLTYQDFTLRSLPYAGNALDQDIICQLLYPTWSRQSRQSGTTSDTYTFGSGQTPKRGAFVDGWHWQPTESDSEAMTWASLKLETLDLPSPGEPDPLKRHQLQQRLESLPMGQSLLEAARYLKLILQQQDRFTLELGDQTWTIMRRELGSRVLLPYVQRLNRELNALLTQTGVPIQSINQVVCTGGTASFGAIARWLRQKLPNATIIQDTYTSSRAGSAQENRLPTCSRVAYGLATLPLHPQVLNLPRQQYSDYFLLMELLRAFPDQPLSITNIMQMLERRGINTQACRLHILALLEGHLPPGLVPTEKQADLLAIQSRQNPDYQMLLAAPLFQKLDTQTYRPNYQQWNHFRSYLSTITASTHQKLSEPLTVGLGMAVQE
jgi:hypothetical protein